MNEIPGLFTAYPLRIPILSSDFAVKAHGKLSDDKRQTSSDELNVAFVYLPSFLLILANESPYAGFPGRRVQIGRWC